MNIYWSEEDFACWAFGKYTWDKFITYDADVIDLMHQWNLLHGDLFKLHGDEPIINSMERMRELYNKRDE